MKKNFLLLILLMVTMTRGYAQYSSATMVWKWDTVICYNEQNEVLERLSQTFDDAGNVLSQLIEEQSGSAWLDVSRVIYTNDAGGRIAIALTELWQANAWVASLRVLVSYDAIGHIMLESVERYQDGLWEAYVNRSYEYDGSGRKLSMLQQRRVGGIWKNDLKATYSYNANINTILMEFSDDGNPWQFGSRFTYTCDLNDNYIGLLIESFEDNTWQSSFKVDYTNDAAGNIISEWAYAPLGAGWVSDSRKTYTYDVNGNVVSGKNERWDAGSWLPDLQSSYLYNKKEYMLLINVPVYRYEASYRGFPLGTEEIQNQTFRLYPNPANDFVTIELMNHNNDVTMIYLQDPLGKPLKVWELDHNRTQLDVQDLPAGLYLISVKTKEGTATRKLIMQ